MSSAKRKLKILMLHGFRQNKLGFYDKTGGLRKFLKSKCELIYCDAPNEVIKPDFLVNTSVEDADSSASPNSSGDAATMSRSETEATEKGWWLRCLDPRWPVVEESENGFDKSLDYIESVFNEFGPIDGILGFSQGASLTSILCAIAEANANNQPIEIFNKRYQTIRFNFCLIIAGHKSTQKQHEIFFKNKIQMPSFHLYGQTDRVIPSQLSIELSEQFVNPKVFQHEQGHFIPVNSQTKALFQEFLNEMSEKFQ